MKKRSNVLTILFFLLSGIVFSLTIYLRENFVSMTFEQLLYSLLHSEGTSFSSLSEGLIFTSIGTILISLLLCSTFIIKKRARKIILQVNYKNHKKELPLFPIQKLMRFSIILFIVSIIVAMYYLNVFTYFKNQLSPSSFYEYNYVNPSDVEITFPKEKQNLIYIYLEAGDSSVIGKENGGYVEKSYIPKLEELALNYTNFSQNSQLGGADVLSNNTWTIAGMVAQTAGITLNLPIDGNSYVGYNAFLPGVTSLGQILEENGYHNYLMIGSDAAFAGRNDYFIQHGNYQIYDYYKAIEDGIIDKNYYVWWGYEDKKLFEYAKKELLDISQNEEPFNFTMLTVDTHFSSGYLDETCSDLPFTNQYANVYYCNSNMVYQFVKWIQEQDFYENTTIVLAGDHYSSQLLPIKMDERQRTYNVFINSVIDTEYSKNRQFTTTDLFPTTLASLGVKIEGQRLGLGTNLFSNYPTLTETYGYDYINAEVIKSSDFYNDKFLGENYRELLDNSTQ